MIISPQKQPHYQIVLGINLYQVNTFSQDKFIMLIFGVCWKVPWCLDIGRLLVGFGMGLLSYVVSHWVAILMVIFNVHKKFNCIPVCNQVPIYIAEITPKNLRGGFTTVHQVEQKSQKYGNQCKLSTHSPTICWFNSWWYVLVYRSHI